MEKIFESLSKERINKVEDKIADYWEEIDVLEKSIRNRKNKPNFVFYEGPPTANGMPGIHHVVARILKDTICKYKTMTGYRVIRKAGWDTHGLPVEIEVEKELGLKSKDEIEKYGIKEFNEKCKESVFRNEKAFADMTKKMGYFIDLKNPYVTYHNDYIETEWWILKRFYEEGYLYQGHKILPYCARCGTGISTHEVAQGYKEVTVDSVTVAMKLVEEDVYFLVWTTTPWTLISNVAIAVNPHEDYIKVESKGYHFILASSLADKVLGKGYQVLQTFKGKELEGKRYEQLIPSLKVDKKAFYVTLGDFVTMEEGTGLVHIAPAFGEDDYQLSLKYDLPVLNPVGEDGKFKEGLWAFKFVMDADQEVIKYLEENNKLFKKQKLEHNYPHCWRCSTPLLYYAKPSWYIEMTKLRDDLIKNNNQVKWVPSFVGEKRFGNWLENIQDWAISRDRYWGTPLNIWKCECGHIESIGSRKELIEKAIEDIDMTIDLHRPDVDDIHILCPKCGKRVSRVKEVIDCWFDSGSMPFAQYHYPFSNQEIFKDQFPADFICEGIDQTRGWFYSLIAISTFLMKETPYKSVLVNDLLLDKDGGKMSKSKGNTVDPFKLFEEYGADVLRWYLLYVSPVWTPTKFDLEGLKEVQAKFFNTYKNTYTFFELYANTDGIDPRTFFVSYKDLKEIDKWLLSKYNKLIENVRNYYEEYDLTKVVRLISEFLNDDFSNWYIRRNRRRFWASELDLNKKAVYKTTYEVLVGLTKLIAPIIPFISEDIYQKLTKEVSVHLTDFPLVDKSLINEVIEKKMDLVRELITLGRLAREEAKIKVRQPLKEVIIEEKHQIIINDLVSLIKEELNVKEVIYVKDISSYMDYLVKPNYKVAGPIFGPKIKDLARRLKDLKEEEVKKLNNDETLKLTIEKEDYILTKELVEIKIVAKEGFNVGMNKNLFIIFNTSLNQDLIDEGIIRELNSKVQQLRKTYDFNVIDRINIYYDGNNEFENALNKHLDYVKKEALAIEVIKKDNLSKKYDLNGIDVYLDVEKR
ncbi:MAG: isoleucine--tRNA ligase [Bacilli bacterium]